MKTIVISIIAAGILTAIIVGRSLGGFGRPLPGNNHKQDLLGSGFAVVELFTSEGCSSCPPADQLVARIQKEAGNQPIYILAFHVDYWDRLGWKDAFSNPEYSQRQEQYATWLHLRTVYTPQIVVNGKQEFVGSEEAILRTAIKTNLEHGVAAQLSITPLQTEKNAVNFQYHASEANHTNLSVAIVQKMAETQVKRGENRGRTLSHIQVVRKLSSIELKGKDSGSIRVALPEGVPVQDLEIVAFLQEPSNGNILAATKSAIPMFK